MSNIFYMFSIIAIIWEIIAVTNPIRISKFIGSFNNKEMDGLNKKQKALSFYMLGYLIWSIIGLFTSQWILFLILIGLGLLPKKITNINIYKLFNKSLFIGVYNIKCVSFTL